MLFGPLPAWGIYVRHAARIQLSDITLGLLGASTSDWVMKDVTGLRTRDCDGLPEQGVLKSGV